MAETGGKRKVGSGPHSTSKIVKEQKDKNMCWNMFLERLHVITCLLGWLLQGVFFQHKDECIKKADLQKEVPGFPTED